MATHIKKLVKNFIKEKAKDLIEKDKIRQIVESVLEERLKKNVSLKRIYKNRLIFSSPSSHFSYELNLKREKVLKAVKKEFPRIEGIRITVG